MELLGCSKFKLKNLQSEQKRPKVWRHVRLHLQLDIVYHALTLFGSYHDDDDDDDDDSFTIYVPSFDYV